MALGSYQLTLLAELVGETKAVVTAAVADFDSDDEAALVDIIDRYEVVRFEDTKLTGDVEIDPAETRAELRRLARERLGTSSVTPTFFTLAGGCRGR